MQLRTPEAGGMGGLRALLGRQRSHIQTQGFSVFRTSLPDEVGCPLRCAFCATGKGGYSSNLKPHEIVEQVLTIEGLFKHRVSNVVFMGMGYRNWSKNGHNFYSGCTKYNREVSNIQASVYIGSQFACSKPEAQGNDCSQCKAYPLDAIMQDCKNYFLETGRRVSFEYTLLVNDSVEQAIELAELLRGWGRVHYVNVVPFNPIDDSEFRRPYKKAVLAFTAALESRRITVSVRQTPGLDASAACGQRSTVNRAG